LFGEQCSRCHANVARGLAPDLRRMTSQDHQSFDDVVLHGQRGGAGMGRFDDLLDEADARAIHAYLVDLAWRDFQGQQLGRPAEVRSLPSKPN